MSCNVLQCTDAIFFSEHLCVLNRMPISIPTIPNDADLLRSNDLFAHLLKALAGSQGMSSLDINPSKGLTINGLLDAKFPAIKSTNNKRTPHLTIRTVAYIHALVIDTVSLHHSETPNQRALRTEQLIIDEHREVNPALWRAEILDCLTGYFEGILKMEGASCVTQVIAPPRKYRDKIPIVTALPMGEPPVAYPPPAPPSPAAEEAPAAEAEAAEAPAPAAEAPAPAAPAAGKKRSAAGGN